MLKIFPFSSLSGKPSGDLWSILLEVSNQPEPEPGNADTISCNVINVNLNDAYHKFSLTIENQLREIFNPDGNNPVFSNFSDQNIIKDNGYILESSKQGVSSTRHEDITSNIQLAAIYKALFQFLVQDNRAKKLDAELLMVISLWQWFSFLKIITDSKFNEMIKTRKPTNLNFLANIKGFFCKQPEMDLSSIPLLDELAYAYKTMNNIIQDPDYFDIIPRINEFGSGISLPSGLDEFMAYSLVLTPLPVHPKMEIEFRKPLPAPGLTKRDSFDWKSVILHPVFKNHRPASVAVIRLVTHYALPSYDFDASLNLAHLMKTNDPLWIKKPTWLFILVLAALSLIPGLILNITSPLDVIFFSVNTMPTSIAYLLFFIGLAAAIFYILKTFSFELIIHLLLPRVWAGILVGYSALIFESSSVEITCALWNSKFLGVRFLWIPILLAFTLAVSWIYLYHDILPWAIDPKETRTRTAQTLGLTFLLSIFIGLIVIPLSTLAYTTSDYCCQILINNIPGAISVPQLIVFIPLAYITGLISQFIFEEKPLTTSVWAPIRE
ncbi:hypothetical protein JR338_06105 [Chloroflexota bacterium]|nr:hypothetical protein JR338_06105 [Chloroflexota bacterium]